MPELHWSGLLRPSVPKRPMQARLPAPPPELPPPRVKDVCGVASGPLGRRSPSSPLPSCASPLSAGDTLFTQSHHQIILPCTTVVKVEQLELVCVGTVPPRALPCPDPDDRKLDAPLGGTRSCSHSASVRVVDSARATTAHSRHQRASSFPREGVHVKHPGQDFQRRKQWGTHTGIMAPTRLTSLFSEPSTLSKMGAVHVSIRTESTDMSVNGPPTTASAYTTCVMYKYVARLRTRTCKLWCSLPWSRVLHLPIALHDASHFLAGT